MKYKLGNITYNFNNTLIIKPQLTSRKGINNNNFFKSKNPIIVNIRERNNSINTRKKKSKSKIIFNSILSSNNSQENYSTLSDKRYKNNKIEKILDSIDYNTLKKNLEMIKFEINKLNQKITNNKNNLDKLIKKLSELNSSENQHKKLLQNYMNKKESLEEMSQTLINNIKNKNNALDNEKIFKVNISFEELYTNNKELFINEILQIYSEINNNSNKKYYNFIKTTIEDSYLDLFSNINMNSSIDKDKLVNNFFCSVSKQISKFDSNEKLLKLLLEIIMKINIIREKINKISNNYEYKLQISEVNIKIDELRNKLISFQFNKNKLIELKNKIVEKIEFFADKHTPFCERIIHQRSYNKKNMILNSFSPSFNFQKHFINKLNINTINKSMNKNDFNESKNKTERNCIQKHNINLIKRVNLKNKAIKYHSNQISLNKISLNEIYQNIPSKKDKGNKEINIKTERGNIESRIQNGLTNDNKKNKKLIEDNKSKNILTNSFNNLNLLELKKSWIKNNLKDCNNGKKNSLTDKKYNNLILLRVNKEPFAKTKREKINETKIKNGMNLKIREYKVINDEYNPRDKKINNNLTNILSIRKSFFNKNNKNSIFINNSKNKYKNIKINEKYRKINQKNNTISKTIDEGFSLKNRENSYMSYQINSNINLKNKQIDSAMKSFCYYKYIDTNSKMFNPLDNDMDLKNSEYNEGLISIDLSTNSIKIGQIHSSQNDSTYLTNSQDILNFSNGGLDVINIELRNITNVYLDKLMENILKIRNIFLKYNSDKEKEKTNKKASININKLLNIREIMNIKDLTRGEKIKAGFCNFFSLIIEYNCVKLEVILINFNQFNLWFNYLKDILCNNIKRKNSMTNGISEEENKLSIIKYNNYRKINCHQTKIKRNITEI